MIPNNKPVAIIGNGTSRKSTVDLNKLKEYMPIYGCNALYREIKCDKLFAIDDVIINEILQSSYPLERFIVPPYDEQFEPAEWNPYRPRENTGMIAMRYAIKVGYNELHCIGMDFLINEPSLNVNNVYDGTNGYGPHTRANVSDCISRAGYFDWFVDKNPKVMFYAIFPEDYFDMYSFRVAEKINFQYVGTKI